MNNGFWRRFRRNKGALAGLAVMAAVLLLALAAPLIAAHDPWAMVQRPFLPPLDMASLPFGTDTMGRDIGSGLAYGARVSLLIGLISTLAGLLIGVSVGALAGYYGGWIDSGLMRFTELFQAIPSFALAIVLVAIFQPSVGSIVTAIALVSWPPVARLVRGEFLTLRHRDFVHAAHLAGESNLRIIVTQILPNAAAPIVVMGSLMVATAILLESSLSFMGLGDPNVMSWGYMIGAARTALRQAWWISLFPGVAILLTVLALNLVGAGLSDGLNTRLDARSRA
ncbi:ABC transporter permease [Achromobacter sp. SD115]|uniref:ABC transporter permease n=1 Tax=Achromobacter sp. SD115 TaxID=2782011 RepID=UPI001A9638A7|nr:ABC transporter permease [Achromobacter sp. SD115]MBO1015725.1 ABC transporter permease [Achromobacter sp. SD115]